MAELFVTQSQVYVGCLVQACEAGDVEEWCSITHQLKGMASFAGTDRLQRICGKAEQCDDNIVLEDRSLLQDIKTEVDLAILEINHYIEQAKE